MRLLQISQNDEKAKYAGDLEAKLHKLELRAQDADAKREEEAFNRRRLEKQILDLTNDTEELRRLNSDLQLKLSQARSW